ncbi:succinyl-diaminopimelate desuccinylase [Actinoplanes sp. NPDC051851]|uniref:succinyl-diaminopimelate desuccinylase n=1 Tax=Actinoplanes sp. NPDC051851 TaxID=3154753 RepID=UPI00344887C7
MANLDLTGDVVTLTQAICDVPSVSGDETALADLVEAALRGYAHLEVLRDGDAVVARTHLGRDTRMVLAGHLDTVPIADNLPTVLDGEILRGRGTTDMKAGVAVMLRLAAVLTEPRHDITYVFYDHEEVAARLNGLGRLVRNHPEWLAGDFAVLGEPSDGTVEGGCQGTMRVKISVPGVAAHSARSWKGSNAIHSAGAVLDVLRAYVPRQPVVEGLKYHEGLNAVKIEGGIAGNVIPDLCTVYVNHRFAPDRSTDEAEAHLREVFAGFALEVTDRAPGARPGLEAPVAKEFVQLVGREPQAKLGWTDVSRFAELGIPAINFGPGDPLLAHTDGEFVQVGEIHAALRVLTDWLS